MGSIDKACISGFLCRLCSEMHRIVIHIYGDQGQRLCLVEKINGYLPITISPTDPLPKTICTTCLRRVEQHYDLLMRLSRIREERFVSLNKNRQRNIDLPDVSSAEYSDDDIYSDEESRRRRQSLPNPSSTLQGSHSTSTSSIVEPSSSSSAVATVDSNPNTINAEDSVASTSVGALDAIAQNLTTLDDAASTSSSHSTPSYNNTSVVRRFELVSPELTD